MLPFERLQKLNTKDNLWIYILLLLKEKPIHAWQLQSLIKENFNFKPGRITPYRVLYRLEKANFVKSEIKERKRIYQITEKGKKELKKAKDFYQKILDLLK
jgi:DNA-binding PadR family transcriptional regulator